MLVIGETDPPAVNKRFTHLRGALAFDIGANCGQSVRRLLPNFAHVVAVEPADESWTVLLDAYETEPNVTLVRAACTDHDGPVTLDVRDIIGTGQLTTGPVGNLPWGEARSTREVPGITVDTLTESHGTPDLLKVDTEGHELFVLQGARQTLGSHPQLLIEIHSRRNGLACRELLSEHGYDDLDVLTHHAYKPNTWGAKNHYWLAT